MLKTNKVFLENLYLRLILILVGLSSIVFIEPAPTDILVVLAFLLGIFSFFKTNYKLVLPALLLFSYIAFNILASFASVDIVRGLISITTKCYLILSWWLFAEIFRKFDERGVKNIFTGYTFAAIFSVLLGIGGFFKIIPLDILLFGDHRVQALFKDPNVFGPFLIPITLYSLSKFESSSNSHRAQWLLVFIITSLGNFLSFSRGSWLNYMVSIAVYIFLSFFKKRSLKIKFHQLFSYTFIAVIIISVFVILFINNPEIVSFFDERSKYQSYDDERFGRQAAGLEYFANNPFSIGIGPGQFEIVFPAAAHSLYIRLLIETSFLGFLSLIGFICITLNRSFRSALQSSYKYQNLFIIITSAIIGILTNGLFVDTIHWRHFWLLLALSWGNYEHNFKHKIG